MSKRPLSLVVTTMTAMALCGLGSPSRTAIAGGQLREPQSTTELDLTVHDVMTPPAAAVPRAKALRCDPPRGNHPHREAACHDVDAAEGDLDRLPGVPGKVCSGVYKPVTATALGEWRGIPVRFHRSYRNACTLTASTGLVFRF
jgi:hypothetical protein